MVNERVLEAFSDNIKTLKKVSKQAGIDENEFKELYFESLTKITNQSLPHNVSKHRQWLLKKIIISFVVCVVIFYFIYNFRAVYSSLICNLQEYIYPGLKFLRKLSIPFISLFPSLTDLYHETCLIQNPFFTVVDMDCWPCSTVNNVREVYNPEPVNQHGSPFLYKTEQQVLKIDELQLLYERNRELFNKEAPTIVLNSNNYVSPEDMFQNQNLNHLHIWKFNTMNVARLLRQLIPRPKVVPKFGQSTERFIILDSSQESFRIPDTECNFSFLLALSSTRNIDLVPAEECKQQCKSLRVELKETYLLWYNWWYWRPVVQPSMGNDTFIAHVGSYC